MKTTVSERNKANQKSKAGSVAIDAGTNSACPAVDQRGIARPVDGNNDGTAVCDVGAYEFMLYRIYLPLVLRNR